MGFENKMCPVLTQASFMAKELARSRDPSKLVAVGLNQPPTEPEPEAVGCQAQNCMWFIPRADENGKLIGGDCSAALIPLAGNQQAMALVELGRIVNTIVAKFSHVGAALEKKS